MNTGTVKWFNTAKGFGFIKPSEGGEDIFVHHSVIHNNGGFHILEEGQSVSYSAEQGNKGMQATKVMALIAD